MNTTKQKKWCRSRRIRKFGWRMSLTALLTTLTSGNTTDITSVAVVKTETRKVTVDCNADHMCVHLPAEMSHIILPECFRQKRHQVCTKGLKGCGTKFNVVNDTHVIYSNEVSYDEDLKIMWKCVYPVEAVTELNFNSAPPKSAKLKEVGIMTQSQVGAGRFYLSFQLFEDPLYKKAFGFRPKLPRDGTIRGRVTLHNHSSLGRATVQLTKCWATPFANPVDGFELIRNFCPVPSGAEVKLLNSGTNHHASFESGVFKFTKSELVYLHCHVRICFRHNHHATNCAVNIDECPTDKRDRRSLEPDPDTTISVGPINVEDAVVIEDLEELGAFQARENIETFQNDNKIRISPVALWSLLIALMVSALGLAMILVYWLREDHQKSQATNILSDQNRVSISSVETA